MVLFHVVSGEGPPQVDGFLEPSVPTEQVRQDAYPLPKEFEWCLLDLKDSKQGGLSHKYDVDGLLIRLLLALAGRTIQSTVFTLHRR